MLLLERRAGVKGGFAAAQRSSTLDARDAFKHHNPSDQGRQNDRSKVSVMSSDTCRLLASFGVTTRSGSSAFRRLVLRQIGLVDLGLLLGKRGEATDASESGPGGRSSPPAAAKPIPARSRSPAAPRSSPSSIADATASAAPPTCNASAVKPAHSHSRRAGFCSGRSAAIVDLRRYGLAAAGRLLRRGSGTPSSATSLIFG